MYVPAEKSEITPRALNDLFAAANAGLPTVTSVTATELGGGNGFLAGIFRLKLQWSGAGASDAPETLVAKLPLPSRLKNMVPEAERMFRREAMFHRVVAPGKPLKTAKAWVAEIDEETRAGTMVFEDMSRYDSFTDDETVEVERIENALDQLAAMHARYWRRTEELESMDWLAFPAKTGVDEITTERFAEFWPKLVSSGAFELSKTHLRLGELLSEKLDGVYEALHNGPESLVHEDLHQENLFFDGNETIFIDWAAAERSNPAKDISKLTASCLEPGTVARHQPALIKRYAKALAAHGVNETSAAEIERYTLLGTCHYLGMGFLDDRDFEWLAANPKHRSDFTGQRIVAACDREELVAAVEQI